MKKTVIRLSLCVLALGLSNIGSQIVNADTTKESSDNSKILNTQMSDTTNKTGSIEASSAASKETITENVTPDSSENSDTTNSGSASVKENETNQAIAPFSAASLPEGATSRASVVTNQADFVAAVKAGGTITLGASFTVSNKELYYNKNFTINGNGNTLTFTGSSYFYDPNGIGVTITLNGLTIKSSVSNVGVDGSNHLIAASGNVNLNLNDFNYVATNGCPIVKTTGTSSSDYVTVNLSGTNSLTTSGSGAPETALFLTIKDINVLSGTTKINDTTPNSSGNQSVIAFSGDSTKTHMIDIKQNATLDITSSKNVLFDLDNKLTMNVGENANFNYKSIGGNNNIIKGVGGAAYGPFTINAQKGSTTLFQTNSAPATFKFNEWQNNDNVIINGYSPKSVEFKSTNPNKPAITYDSTSTNKQKIIFNNKEDSSATTGNYVLDELPTDGSGTLKTYEIGVGKNRTLDKGSFQDVIYHKSTPSLTATSSVGAKVSTIRSALGGSYTNYTNVQLLAVPTEITDVSDTSVANAIAAVTKDTSGKSGYYQSGEIPTGGELNDFTDVWAGTYYLYAKLTNTSANTSSDWLKATVTVEPLMRLRGTEPIGFVGGYKLSLKQVTTVTSEGNVDTTLTYNGMKENAGSSQEVKLVTTPTTDSKELRLNMTVKNDNKLTTWSPMLLSTTTFPDNITLSPYWVESTNNAVFSVNGNYSGPLGKDQLVNVSYKVYLGVSSNN